MKDELTGIDRDKLIGYDFQGWPVYKKTLRELLKELGAVENGNSFIGFNVDDPILDIYPRRLRDDGMAYGIDEEYFIVADIVDSQYINFFTQKPMSENRLDEWFAGQQEYAREIKNWYKNRRQSGYDKK